ncbi:hypothetical protein AAF712_003302 [Marasmius tenuissimus]|uniref:Uncharacterized protein n=1 Tax=Marasmius tenuissimus TaxID=585030 RepID=A0ABR3A8G9_9AGAR
MKFFITFTTLIAAAATAAALEAGPVASLEERSADLNAVRDALFLWLQRSHRAHKPIEGLRSPRAVSVTTSRASSVATKGSTRLAPTVTSSSATRAPERLAPTVLVPVAKSVASSRAKRPT